MNIYQRMAEVMKDIQYLAKDDNVEFKTTKYKAISEEKVTSTMRKALIDHGLVVFPIKQQRERIGNITSVDVTYRLQNVDDPEDYIEVVSSGDGADTQDKGAGKAMTYAFKYMFLRTFAIPTGEDPDKISSAELDEKDKPELIGEVEAETLKKCVRALGGNTNSEFKRIVGFHPKEIGNLTKPEWAKLIADLNNKMDDAAQKRAMEDDA